MTARITAIDVGTDPVAWAMAGFAIQDGTVRLGGVVIRCTGRGGGITGWALQDGEGSPLGVADVDGLPCTPVDDAAPAGLLDAGGVTHPSTAVALDHVVIATPDLDRTTSAFADVGWSARRTIADPRGGGRTMRFFVVPTGTDRVVLEVVHDPTADLAAPTFWGLAVTTTDLDAAARTLGPVLGAPRPAVQPGRRIATVRGDQIGLDVPLALLSPR